MFKEHEYALLGGVNRSKVGRYIAVIAAFVSSGLAFILLYFVDVARKFGLPVNLPPAVLSALGAGGVFLVIYWLFDRHFWKLGFVGSILGVPNLAGAWKCQGQTFSRTDGAKKDEWTGTVTIVQSWDKLRVRLKTENSGSNSVTAALSCDEADGYHLLYNYQNDPKAGIAELRPHRGFAQLTFAKDRQTAEGEYFNGFGRDTFGTFKLVRA